MGCGERISINKLWKAIQNTTGTSVDAIYGPQRDGDVSDSLASLEKVRERLDYDVRVSLSEGLQMTFDWLSDHSR